MTLDKAIKISAEFLEPLERTKFTDTYKAIQLGIEAVKRVQNMRISPCTTADEILPGETTD